MKLFKFAFLTLIAASMSFCVACSCSQDKKQENTQNPNNTQTQEPVTHDPVNKEIGKNGGNITDENISINIPAGALSKNTAITAQYVEEESIVSQSPIGGFLGAVEFGPSGTTFDKPVEVTMKLTNTPKKESVSIFCYDEVNKIWDFVCDASVTNNSAKFSVTHFSYYKALDLSSKMVSKFNSLVKTAIAENRSDSWIIDNFVNYLVNEEYVLDYYTEYQGLLYEPCGLHVSGNYFMNGKEGDSEALSSSLGESNKVGDTYGVSTIASETDSYNEYMKEKKKPASERKEITDVTFIIYYKMIKPNIEASANKTVLKEGETATVNVFTHYSNPLNHFPEFQDVVLPYYPLTLPNKLVNYTVSTEILTTNAEGKASFTVTCINEEPETIKILFHVEGPFGETSDAYVAFNNAGYLISGHISEEMDVVYSSVNANSNLVVTQYGTFKLKVEYDFEGSLKEEEDGTLNGTVSFTNPTMSLNTTPMKSSITAGSASGTGLYDHFNAVTSTTPHTPSYSFAVSNIDGLCKTSANGDASNIISFAGTGYTNVKVPIGPIDDTYDNTYSIDIRNSGTLLLDFELTPGTKEYSSTSFKDLMHGVWECEGEVGTFENLTELDFKIISESNKTAQTITVNTGAQQ